MVKEGEGLGHGQRARLEYLSELGQHLSHHGKLFLLAGHKGLTWHGGRTQPPDRVFQLLYCILAAPVDVPSPNSL